MASWCHCRLINTNTASTLLFNCCRRENHLKSNQMIKLASCWEISFKLSILKVTQGGIGLLFCSASPSKQNLQCDYMNKKGAERHYKFIRIQTGTKEGQINNVVRVKRVHTVQFHSSLDSIKSIGLLQMIDAWAYKPVILFPISVFNKQRNHVI